MAKLQKKMENNNDKTQNKLIHDLENDMHIKLHPGTQLVRPRNKVYLLFSLKQSKKAVK